VSDFRASERWYKDRFGFITSDEIALSPSLSLGAFLRCDRATRPPITTPVRHPAPHRAGFIHAPSKWPISTT